MALIKTLKDFLTKTVIYPQTKTQAVYDDTVGRLDTYLHNTLGAEPIDDIEEPEVGLRDADTLGGRYTAEDLDAMPKSSAVEDYANVEPPMNDADALGGKKASEYVTKDDKLGFIFEQVNLGTFTISGTGRQTSQEFDLPIKNGYVCIPLSITGNTTRDIIPQGMIVQNGRVYGSFYSNYNGTTSYSFILSVLWVPSPIGGINNGK